MADLTGKRVKDTYKDLLKISPDANNTGIDATDRVVTDGDGTPTPLKLSSSKVTSDAVDIGGGAIDGTVIGAEAQAHGSFDNIGVKGLMSLDSAQTINPTGSMSSINVEDTLITKAGFFGGMLKGSKANYYDFLLIKPYDADDGGSFVLDLELITTSGFDTTVPSGWINVTIEVSASGTVTKFFTAAGIDTNFIPSSAAGGSGAATQFLLKDVNNVTLGASLNHNTNHLATMDTFVDVNGGTLNGWTNTGLSNNVNLAVAAGELADGTYTGKVRFFPPYHNEVLIDNFKADGETFSYSKVSMIGMSRDLSLLGVDDTSTYDAHKVCFPDAPASQNWVTGMNYGEFKSGTNGSLYPEAMQAGYAYDSYETAGTRTRYFGNTEDGGGWPYEAGYNLASNVWSMGSFGKKWPKMNDAYNWAKTKYDTSGNATDAVVIPDITQQPVWGNSTSFHNNGVGDGIEDWSPWNNDIVEHTVEVGAVMSWSPNFGGFRVRLFCTAGWSGAPSDNGTVFGINYNAKIISSRGNAKRYVQKVYRTDWSHEVDPIADAY